MEKRISKAGVGRLKLAKSIILKVLILTLFAFVLVFLQLKWNMASYLSSERIQGWLRAAGPFAPIL